MSKHLQRDLDNLQRDLMTLAGTVEEQLQKALKALRERQPSLARQVIDKAVGYVRETRLDAELYDEEIEVAPF